MKVIKVQYVSQTGGSRAYVKGSAPGVCYYEAGTNSLYSWDGSAWAAAAIDGDAFYAFQGQLYPVVSGVIWGLGENWGSQDLRTYVSKDEDGYMDVAIVSDSSLIRQREVPTALAYSSISTGASQGSNYVKRVDLTGCAALRFGESANTGMLQGLTNCQELLLPTNCNLYCYYLLAILNSTGSTSPSTLLGYAVGGRRRPVVYAGGSVDAGTGPGITRRTRPSSSAQSATSCSRAPQVLHSTTPQSSAGRSRSIWRPGRRSRAHTACRHCRILPTTTSGDRLPSRRPPRARDTRFSM